MNELLRRTHSFGEGETWVIPNTTHFPYKVNKELKRWKALLGLFVVVCS